MTIVVQDACKGWYLNHEPKVQDTKMTIRGSQEIAWMRICTQKSSLKELHKVAIKGCGYEGEQVSYIAL